MNSTQALYRVTRTIWYIFYIIETFLLVRFALKLFGANPDVTFTHFVYGVTQALIAPFEYVFGTLSLGGSGIIDMNTLLAIIVYWIIAWALVSLFAMSRPVDEREAERELQAQDNSPY